MSSVPSCTFALLVGLSLALAGCGGDDSPAEPTPAIGSIEDDGATEPDLGFNGPLSGRIFTGRRFIDLVSGEYGEDLSPARAALSVAVDGRTFYYIRENCRDRPERAGLFFSCVVVLDAARNELDVLDPSLDLSGNAPEVSPDGRFIAVDTNEIAGVQSVVILDPNGQILDEAPRASNVGRIDWGSDGALYYAADGAVFRATVGDDPSNDVLIRRFDEEAEGSPLRVRVSPDGTRLAVELDTSESATEQEAAVWLLNADGTDLRRLAIAEFIPTVRRPRWSPDGRWLLVSAGGFNGATGLLLPSPVFDLGGGQYAIDTTAGTFSIDDLNDGDDVPGLIQIHYSCTSSTGVCDLSERLNVERWLP